MSRIRKMRQPEAEPASSTIGYNAQRDKYLFWRTKEGYIIAQDVNCQHDYVSRTPCESCGGPLRVVAHINRAGQGLSEIVVMCEECRQRTSFIFDTSNDVFQAWWSEQLGPLYVRQYDEAPREPFTPD